MLDVFLFTKLSLSEMIENIQLLSLVWCGDKETEFFSLRIYTTVVYITVYVLCINVFVRFIVKGKDKQYIIQVLLKYMIEPSSLNLLLFIGLSSLF